MSRLRKIAAPGRAIEITVPLGKFGAEPIPDCESNVTGLFWFSDATGLFDQPVEAAYLLTAGAAGPVLAVAGLVGESCDLPVVWTKTWTPASGTGGDPGTLEDGTRLIVYPLADTAPGALEVSAEHDGQTYGPIALILDVSGGGCTPNFNALYWAPVESENTRTGVGAQDTPGLYVKSADFSVTGDPDSMVWCCDCVISWTIYWGWLDESDSGSIEITTTGWYEWNGIDTKTRIFLGPDVRQPVIATIVDTPVREFYVQLNAMVLCGNSEFGPFNIYFEQSIG